MTRTILAAFAAVLLTAAAAAQDVVPQIDYNGALDHSRVTGRMVRQAQQRQRPAATSTVRSRARATCADKRRVAARLSAAEARHLYALCQRAGY